MATLTIADLDNGKRDLETVDAVANSPADTTTTRYGDSVLTLAGALRRLGWQAPVPYAPGLNITAPNATVSYGGSVYRPKEVPFITGEWDPEQWVAVQDDPFLRDDLTNAGDSSPGASIIGFDGSSLAEFIKTGNFRVINSVEDLRGLSKSKFSRAITLGYYAPGDGGGGMFFLDSADTSSADNGGSNLVASDGGRWKLTDSAKIDVRQFGVKTETGFDNSSRLLAVRDHVASSKKTLVVPAGVYEYSVSPNWDIPHLSIEVVGEVRFRYTGTEDAFIINDSTYKGLYGLNIGPKPIIIEAQATAKNGVYINAVHHSDLRFNVRGCGAEYAGMRIDFAVCSRFPNFTVSNNQNGGSVQGWYLGARPKYGLYLTRRIVPWSEIDTCSYCLFENPILEGMPKGAYLDYAMGNIFIGGTMEGCSEDGAYLTANAFANKWYGTDFEANTEHDVYCLGRQNQFTDIDTLYLLTFDGIAHDNRVLGGNHNQISLTSGTYSNQVGNLVVNRGSAGGTVSDESSGNRIFNIRDAVRGLNYNRPPSSVSIPVGPSPYVYTNTSAQDVEVAVAGGSGVEVVFSRPSTGSSLLVGAVGKWRLSPGDRLSITHTAAPAAVVYST